MTLGKERLSKIVAQLAIGAFDLDESGAKESLECWTGRALMTSLSAARPWLTLSSSRDRR